MSFNGVDGVFMAVLLVSVVIGAVRGLIYEVLSCFGWVVAYGTAQLMGPILAPALPNWGNEGSDLNVLLAWGISFIVTLFAWGILTWVLQKLVQSSPLRPVDRAMGAVFGTVRAVLIGLVAAFAVHWVKGNQATIWQESFSARYLTQGIVWIRPVLPADFHAYLPPVRD